MMQTGQVYQCRGCRSQVEVLQTEQAGGPLVCCEMEMGQVGDEFAMLWEKEAYDAADFQWD